MNKNEISKSFDDLIENMSKLLPELNQQGSEFIEKHQYHEAKEIISKAQTVISLQKKLGDLKEEWLGLESSPFDKFSLSQDTKSKVSHDIQMDFRSQSHTSSKDFKIPILQALVNLGGSAARKRVFKELEKIMGDRLSENDWELLPSRKSMTRWQKNAQNARNELIEEGYITAITEKGIWIITDKGRALLNEFADKDS